LGKGSYRETHDKASANKATASKLGEKKKKKKKKHLELEEGRWSLDDEVHWGKKLRPQSARNQKQ